MVGIIKQASGCIAAAIKALSLTLWHAQALTDEQMRVKVLEMVMKAMDEKTSSA